MENARPQHGLKERIDIQGEGPATETRTGFQFGRMFGPSEAPPMILKQSTSVKLGGHMTSQSEAERADTDVPAGYTYLGQFIDHDITLDVTETANEGDDASTDVIEATDDDLLLQARSPSLDLDSLYGTLSGARPDFVSGFRFNIGSTTGTPGAGVGASGKAISSDLPRQGQEAQIGDPRNDENLAVAQTHLMFLHFHNAIAETLAEAAPGSATSTILSSARDLVTRHYQHIVLHDYLPQILDPGVYQDIIVGQNRKVLTQGPGETAFMPLEFSVAAFRLGHSQVRETYEWNVNFGTDGAVVPAPAGFDQLFRFSGLMGNLGGLPTLPTNWVADFRRLFDLSGHEFPNLAGSATGPLNVTKALDPYIAPALGRLPGPPAGMNNLAMLNLRRGGLRALPSGQDVSRALPSVKMLTKTQMQKVLDPAFQETMEQLRLYERTPLWLYILIEASHAHEGQRLGPLGSTIVADTFLTLVLTSRTSVLSPRAPWTPAEAQATLGAAAPLETVADILAWTDLRFPVVDAVQDVRNS